MSMVPLESPSLEDPSRERGMGKKWKCLCGGFDWVVGGASWESWDSDSCCEFDGTEGSESLVVS